jgi:N-acetylmuramoyl-L-alanine amidase
MPAPPLIRRGSRGEDVRDLQQRLASIGYALTGDDGGVFGAATERAVHDFQTQRGLRVDGIVGRETWSALVESGFALGDRLLYFRRPMLRGDDVANLQRRLNTLGFDSGREDGIFGTATVTALTEFQRNSGLPADGICGDTTIAALERVGTMADGEVSAVREREALRRAPRSLVGRKVFVTATPGFISLGETVARFLRQLGTEVVVDTSGADDSSLATTANDYGAELFVAIRSGDHPGCRCTYFASGRFRSEAGFQTAVAVAAALGEVLGTRTEAAGRTYTALRETRMAAVVCELLEDGDVEAMRELVAHAPSVGRAIVKGIQATVESPADRAP